MLEEIESCLETLQSRYVFPTIGMKIGLWGAGRYGSVVLDYLKENGFNVVCYIDRSFEKQGRIKDGVKIVAPDDLIVESLDCILSSIRNVGNQEYLSFDAFYINLHIRNFFDILNGFDDDLSKVTLSAVLLATITGEYKYCTGVVDFNQYFCFPHFRNTCNDIFADVGAFVGDTLEEFIKINTGVFQHIYAFEPMSKNFDAINHRVKRLKLEWALDDDSISLFNIGIGGQSSAMEVSCSNGPASFIGEVQEKSNSEGISVRKLDDLLNGKSLTFLKADIEGMEMEMLHGAKQLILDNKPKIAICVYHNIFDIIDITYYLKELVPEYKMAIRHHSPSLSETVLYCWVE